MTRPDAITQLIHEKIDALAEQNCVAELSVVCALCLTLGDVDTVNYIGDRYGHMFNEEQQAAFADIKARTPEIKAAEAELVNTVVDADINDMVMSDNPLTQHLQQLNRTVQ